MERAWDIEARDKIAANRNASGAQTGVATLFRRGRLILPAVLFATAILYLRCLRNGFVLDDHQILGARGIGEWSFLWSAIVRARPQIPIYRPLEEIWYALHLHLFGLSPIGWHATSVALYLLVVWLTANVAERLTADLPAALLATILFALLPVHAYTVSFIAAVDYPLMATFELAAFYCFMSRGSGAGRNSIAALGLYPLALLSHESAVAFPGLIWFYVLLIESAQPAASEQRTLRLRQRTLRATVRTAPFAIELLLYMAVHRLLLGFFVSPPKRMGYAISSAQALMTVPRVLATYLAMLAIPWLAAPAHRLEWVSSVASPGFYLPVIVLIGLAGGFLWLIREHPRRRLYLFCAAWMGVTVIPLLNLRLTFMPVQDCYLYMASMAWCVFVGDWAMNFARAGGPMRRYLLWSLLSAQVAVCSLVIWNQQAVWHDDLALFSRCVQIVPDSPTWHRMLATTLDRRGDLARAEDEFRKTLALAPADAEVLHKLAIIDMRLGRIDEAVREAGDSIRLSPATSPAQYILLAKLDDMQGDQERSEQLLKRAESMAGGIPAVGVARAQMRMAHGDAPGAAQILLSITHDYPDDVLAWVQLGLVLAGQKQYERALEAFQRAHRVSPDDPSIRLLSAQVLHAMGRDSDALELCRQMLASAPNDADARALLVQIQRRSSGP